MNTKIIPHANIAQHGLLFFTWGKDCHFCSCGHGCNEVVANFIMGILVPQIMNLALTVKFAMDLIIIQSLR